MTNQQQSPIHIKSPIVTKYSQPLKVHWSRSLDGVLKPHHGKVQVVFSGDQKERISYDGRDFHIVQFHFHHKSEHWIEGKQSQMELHIVHQNCDPNDGSLAVLGIMIEADSKAKSVPSLIDLMETQSRSETRELRDFKTNPNEWLPENTEHYYRYQGSLTTPAYDENVSWIVFKEPRRLPQKEINKLIRCTAEPARLPQPLNRRFVLSNFS